MNKKESEELTSEMLITDALLRIKTIENLLVAKGLFTKEEFLQEMESIAKQIAKSVLQKAGVTQEIDELLKSLQMGHNKSGN